MRVVSVLHFPEFAGPQNQSLRLAKPLADVGVESISILPPGPGAERLSASGVEIITMPLGRVRAVPSVRLQAETAARLPLDLAHLNRVFQRIQPDVVQINGLINPHAAIVARTRGIPVVWQLLDTRPPFRVRQASMALVRTLADVIMPIGHAVEVAHPGADKFGERSIVFYPPVDTQEFQRQGPSTLRQELGIASDDPIVGVVANINPQKGHEYLFEAFGIARKSVPLARLVLAGHVYEQHRVYLESLREIGRRFGLIEGTDYFFLGSRSDIPNVLSAFDLFAFSPVPLSEGTSTSVVEALSMSIPVVTTRVASIPEVIIDGSTGVLVDPQDAQAFAVELIGLLVDPAKRKTMGERAAIDVRNRFSLERCVAAHVEAYEKAIAYRQSKQFRRLP